MEIPQEHKEQLDQFKSLDSEYREFLSQLNQIQIIQNQLVIDKKLDEILAIKPNKKSKLIGIA